jgi:hypothetical protein
MAHIPDLPDKWTVSGVSRSFASKLQADKVRSFLQKNPPPSVKRAIDNGEPVDDKLPTSLKKLPRWGDVYKASEEPRNSMRESTPTYCRLNYMQAMEDLFDAMDCGCFEKIRDAKDLLAKAIDESKDPKLDWEVAKTALQSSQARSVGDHVKASLVNDLLAQKLKKAGHLTLGAKHAKRAGELRRRAV